MRNYLILPILLLTSNWCQAGFFELTNSSYSGTQFYEVANVNDGSDTIGVNDIVRSVQAFSYSTPAGASRTALAISISRVSAENTLTDGSARKQYLFGAPTGSEAISGPNSISSFVSAFTSTYASQIKSTGASTVGGDVFALLSTSGAFSLSSSTFNFESANFGLNTGSWSVDFTAGYSSDGYQEWLQNYVGGGTIDLDPENTPGGFNTAGSSTNFEQKFAYTITSVRDEFGTYTAGSGGIAFQSYNKLPENSGQTLLGNVGTTSANTSLVYGYTGSGTAPIATDFSSSVTVSLPAPGAVPEPSSILVLAGLGVLGMTSRRRKR